MATSPVSVAAAKVRAHLASMETAVAKRLATQYAQVYARLLGDIRALELEVGNLGDDYSKFKRARLTALANHIEYELNKYGAWADIEIDANVHAVLQQTQAWARLVALAGLQGPVLSAVSGAYHALPVAAVETMLGYISPESALRQSLVEQLGTETAKTVSDGLFEAIVRGTHPRQLAYTFRKELGIGLDWSLRTNRTAMLYAYRDGAIANYAANPLVVEGWIWRSARSERTCMGCLAMDGTFHPNTERLNDHHSGRCFPEAVTRFFERPSEDDNGANWFKLLNSEQQKRMMGPGKYQAWQDGKFDIRDLKSSYKDPVFGEMIREIALQDLPHASD